MTTGVRSTRGGQVGQLTSQLQRSSSPGEAPVRRALIALLTELAAPAPLNDEEEVVLCVDLGGLRYTLIHQRAPQRRPAVALSAREQEIARLISGGHTNKTVAAVLEISLWTVDTHIRRIFAKLGVRSRSAMVARLAEFGLLAGDSELPSRHPTHGDRQSARSPSEIGVRN